MTYARQNFWPFTKLQLGTKKKDKKKGKKKGRNVSASAVLHGTSSIKSRMAKQSASSARRGARAASTTLTAHLAQAAKATHTPVTLTAHLAQAEKTWEQYSYDPERAYKKCKERLGSDKDAWKKDTACKKAHIAWKKHKSSSATDSVSGRKGKKRFGKNKFRAADRKDWSQAAEEEAMDLPLDEEGYEEGYEDDYEDEKEGIPMWMMAAGGLGLLWFLSGR